MANSSGAAQARQNGRVIGVGPIGVTLSSAGRGSSQPVRVRSIPDKSTNSPGVISRLFCGLFGHVGLRQSRAGGRITISLKAGFIGRG